MKKADHQVLVLDDDPWVRGSLKTLLTANGFRVRLHAQPEELFAAGLPAVPACLLLDNQLGGEMTGVQVHSELLCRGWDIPTVFLTGHWNVQSVVSAIRSGADGFLTKPYDPKELLHAVRQALDRARTKQRDRMQVAEACARSALLTPREREVVRLVASGFLNKEIADELDIALVTVKLHRARAMAKLGAGNAAELARIATLANLCP